MNAPIVALPDPFVDLRGRHFATVLADPPWLFTNKTGLPAAKPQQVIEGPRKSLAQDLNELGF